MSKAFPWDGRTRRRCPYHKRLCYGSILKCYDTTRVTFDCGTFADYGYGYWDRPRKPKEEPAE